MSSEPENSNREFLAVILVITAILSWIGLCIPWALCYRTSWNEIIPLVFAWVIADYLSSFFETENKGKYQIRNRTLPLHRITVGFCLYFIAIVIAEEMSEHVLTPLLLVFLASIVQRAQHVDQAHVIVVSFSASLFVFLNLKWRTKSDKRDETKHAEKDSE